MHHPRWLFNLRGYNPRPVVPLEPGWAPHMFCVRMSEMWAPVEVFGRKDALEGSHYAWFPEMLNNGRSPHYDPTSAYFQRFTGVYVVPSIDGHRVPYDVFPELGMYDNLGWLQYMGDPNPISTILETGRGNRVKVGEGRPARLVSATYRMHLDFGDAPPKGPLPALLSPPTWDAS